MENISVIWPQKKSKLLLHYKTDIVDVHIK